MMGGSNFMSGMMGGYFGNNYYSTGFYSMMTGFEFLGLISGILVLVFAILLKYNPSQGTAFGILVLIFSLVSLTGTGGFFIGAILGIVGGIVALTR